MGFYTARGHLCVSVLSSVSKESMGLSLAHAEEPAGCSLRVTQAMLFIPSPPRPSALLESICVSQQVPRKNGELR